MDVFINGEIYIKNGPDIFYMDNQYKEMIKQMEINSIDGMLAPYEEEYLNNMKIIKEAEGSKDYSYCDEFWISTVEENGINMSTCPYYSSEDIEERFFTDKKELDRHFTRLMGFLNNAEYVGKYFKRTASIGKDKSYMDSDNECLVLYSDGKRMLVLEKIANFEPKFEMLRPRYIEDGNYEFYGEYTDKYKDKVSLYKAISNQLISRKKERQR